LFSAVGLLWIGWASAPWMLYGALTLSSLGSGLVNPASTGLISLYCGPAEQGRVLGIFRSLGSLSRAITPVVAGLVFWGFGPRGPYVTYGACAVLSLGAFALSTTLPKPHK
jgi:MFS family permease